MISISRNVRIGLFAVGAFVILCFGLNYLKGRDLLFRGNKYYCYVPNVDGLTDASPIFYNGYKVGAVRQINVNPQAADERRRFEITLAVNMNLYLPKDSKALIYSTDILGGKGIRFVPGTSPELLESGDTIPMQIDAGMMGEIAPLKSKAESMITHLDSTLIYIGNIIGGDNGRHVGNALASIDRSMAGIEALSRQMAALSAARGPLAASLHNMDSITSALNANTAYIDSVMRSMNTFGQKLSRTSPDSVMQSLNAALTGVNSLLTSIDSARGTLGMLVNDPRLYDRLAESSANLNRLLVDVRMNPSRYVNISAMDFGKNIYFGSPVGDAMLGIVYQVRIAESKAAVDFGEATVGGCPVVERYDGKRYTYLLGAFRQFAPADSLRMAVSAQYPKAEVVAFDNGTPIALAKARAASQR